MVSTFIPPAEIGTIEVHLAAEELQVRQQNAFVLNVDFVHRKNYRRAHHAVYSEPVISSPLGTFNHEAATNVTDGAAGSFVHQAVDGALFFHMQPRIRRRSPDTGLQWIPIMR